MTRWTFLWLVAVTTASVAWCVSAGRELGATFDEPAYFTLGHAWWDQPYPGKKLPRSGIMPLPPIVDAIPVRIAEWWRGEPFDLNVDYAGLYAARLGTLAFWLLLLGSAFRAGQIWSGTTAGVLAVTLLAVEPIVLGHASIAATDLAFTACLVFFVVVYKLGRDAGVLRRLVFPSLAAGLTLLAKLSGLTFLPICVVALEAESWWLKRQRGETMAWTKSLREATLIGVGAFAIVFGVCPFAGEAIRFQVVHNFRGHGAIFLFGEMREGGFWYYFLAALAIKASLGFAAILAMTLLRPRFLLSGPMLAGFALLATSPTCRVQVGVRFMLPAFAIVIVGAAIALGRHLTECRFAWSRRLTWAMLAVAVTWTAAESLRVWPHGIAYANQFVGGPANGYLFLTDSNHDWGQGLRDLARWRDRHATAPIDVCYFGADPAFERLGFRRVSCLDATSVDELHRRHQGRYLAISTTVLYGHSQTSPDLPSVQILRALPRVGRTMTFLIYDFTDVTPSEVVAHRVSRSTP
jgi:hypothetical protein